MPFGYIMGDRYKPLCELGAGAFGKALVVRDTKTQIKHVSKVIQIKGLSSRALDRCVTEVAVLSTCSHPNIVRYIEAFVSSGALHIVMEYASGGDLQQKIEKQNGVLFTSDMVLEWFLQVVLALEYIHSKNILHRDLKPQNIFLTDNGIVKLGDFGIARVLNSCDDLASTRIGTPFYISPEICEGKQYNSSSDMWAAGCLLYQMCTLRVPFHASNFDDLTKKIIKAEYEPIPSHFSEVIKLIVSKLLVATPDNRLSASKLLTLEPLRGMVLYLKNRNNRKGEASRSRSNSLVTARSRTQFHQKPRSASVNRLHKGNNENSETNCQVRGQNQTVKRPDTDKVETRYKNDRKNTTETAEKKSCCKHTVRSEQTDREDSQKHVKISDVKDTDGMQRNTEVQGCGVESLENKSHVGCVNETVGRNVLNDESKLKIDKKNKAISARTFTIKDSVARRLSEASPKLAQTVRKQRFSLSISEPFALNKMKSGNDGNHDNQEDFVDDVFQSPEVLHRQRIDSQTYLVREQADSDANNNGVKSSCSNVEKDQTKNYVNTTMVQALSVSKFNIELTKNILYDEIRLKIGNKQCDHLINQVRRLIVEDGQSYQCLRHKLIEEELELLPLICMYLTV